MVNAATPDETGEAGSADSIDTKQHTRIPTKPGQSKPRPRGAEALLDCGDQAPRAWTTTRSRPGGREGRRPPAHPQTPTLEWTIITAEGDLAEQLKRAQARRIKEILRWVTDQQHRSRSNCSAPGLGPAREG